MENANQLNSASQQQALAPAQPHHERPHAHADIPQDLPKVSNRTVMIAGIVAAGALLVLFLVGWIPRHHRLSELENEAKSSNENAPLVQVAQPKRETSSMEVILPADVRSYQETALFPRANGYLKRQMVDIGDRVQKD